MNRLTRNLSLLILLISVNCNWAAERPNIILMMADDMGWGDPQCFNPESPIKTPHLDEMAAEGVKFNRFYSGSSVCSPTRGSCLTGRHPYRYGIYNANTGHLKQQELSLAELLKQEGYATGHFGKWHLGTLTKEIKDANRGGPQGKKNYATPQMNGYDTCLVTESKVPTYDPLIKPKNAGKNAWDHIADPSKAVSYGTHYWNEKGESVEDLTGDDSRIVMDAALPFISEAVKAEKPFFTVIWFHAPHLPVVAGPKHLEMYKEHGVYERNYYGCITALDEQVGRLREQLRAMNVADNTMLWFCSDNGPEGKDGKAPGSAGPFRGRKRALYEGGVRVPGILEWPGHTTIQETDFPCVTSDYFPTILDALKLTAPTDRPMDGISLISVLSGEKTERSKPIGFHYRNSISYVTQRHKLLSNDNGKKWELYDLLEDPAETNDLAKSNTAVVNKLKPQLLKWVTSCKHSDNGGDYSSDKSVY